MKAPFLCCGFLLLFPFILKSQSRCGAAEYERLCGSQEKKFEQWMEQKKKENSLKKSKNELFQTQGTSVIPVVVHVIHNGEPAGRGGNISDEQIMSQIKVLNNDYQRMNADAVKTPDEFAGVAGRFDIQFVLAKRTPDNRPTNGILRMKGNQESWSLQESAQLKALSYWPAEKYLNIWVTALETYIGYAQFPDYNLPGIGSDLIGADGASSKNRETDGVVIDYSVMGSNEDNLDNPKFGLKKRYNLGRTATHEIGHYFGLRHVWGDKTDCTGTDYVGDTPPQDTDYNSKSPATPQFSCGGSNMYQNYLNYTDDKAMNLFTKEQVQRMSIVLNNSPRRKDLLTSPGATELPEGAPQPQYDIEVAEAGPITVTCNPTYTPTVVIRNKSAVDLYKIQVRITINRIVSIADVNVPPVPNGKSFRLKLNPFNLNDGTNAISVNAMPPDDQEDTNPSDNTFSYSVILDKSKDIVPLRENFESAPTWLSVGTNNFNWNIVKAETNAAKSSLFGSLNQKEFLVSPVLDFSKLQKASVFFDISYGYKTSSFDTLKLLASKDCGASYEPAPLYMKTGKELSAAAAETSWLPTIPSDWRREFISLSDLTDNRNLRFAFFASGNGNNIFIDNIEFYNDDNPMPISVAPGYSVYGLPNDYRITLNLEKRQDIIVQLLTVAGEEVMQEEIPNALNQTFFLNTNYVPPGIYIFRILGNETAGARILVK